MKKEEFPTFLNEQPTVVFGRTMRELMIILIGLTFGYLTWANLGLLLPEMAIGNIVLRGFGALIPLSASVAVAFVNVGSRPLEEWGTVGLFYCLTPKVFIYIPLEESGVDGQSINTQKYEADTRDFDEDDDEIGQP